MQSIYSRKFEGNFLERPTGKSTNEESKEDGKSTLNMSSKKWMFVPMYREKKHVKNYVSHSEINIHSCEDCDLKILACNVCKRSYRNLREFKCNQCLDGSLCYDYLLFAKNPIHTWNMMVKMMHMIICKTAFCILSMLVEAIFLLLMKWI